MAQLKDTVISGSLRVTDTTYTNDLIIGASKTKNWFLGTPSSADGAPTFRALVATDIPTLSITDKTSGTLTVARGGTGLTTASYKNAIITGNGTTVTNAFTVIRTGSGALYATAQDGAAVFGTLPVAQGGTGATSFTANSLIISGSTTTAALTTRAIYDRTSTNALNAAATWANSTNIPTLNTLAYWDGRYQTTSNKSNLTYCVKGAFGNACTYAVDDATANGALGTGTGLTTERSVYYGLVTVNNASQTRATGIYAPTSAGTANQILVSAGGTSAPTWKATSSGAAYATSSNGALTFGTLPIAQGGTGTSTAPTQWGIIYASSTTDYASTEAGTAGYLLQSNATSAPSWIQATDANTGSTIVKRDASGNFSAGTITASLSGNATTATTASYLSAPNEAGITSDQYGNFKHKRSTNTDYWQIQNSAGTTKFSVYPETGKVAVTGDIVTASGGRVGGSGGALYLGNSDNSNWVLTQDICSHTGSGDTYWSARANGTGHFKSVYGAVWNDYAEMRNVPEAQLNINRICDEKGEVERDYPCAGRCVSEIGNGEMKLTNKRMQKGCKIISDTFGFCIGETENCKTPIAVTGRVLAYPLESLKECAKHIGDFVCSGPNGTVSIMTSLEAIRHPESIIGTISEIPTYEIWHCGNKVTKPIQVNNRIWIYVR